ncbi:DUF1289 domain-containing protein [Erythrobacter sp. 3-20A1M]|uniref:DUF1289 domain-containing protein n=2 Tax=unclassified Erythrobacter TaxID=2633097 RepID=UPI002040623C|nr:DUF1289 domain-containing protein [Erythrobacter sp. 3-20A1M]
MMMTKDDNDETASPCRKVCQMSEDRRICIGCGRTLQEIAQWSSLSPNERRLVNDAAARRLARLEAG